VTDLVIFIGIVGLVIVVGILVGMIVAGRIDRILAPKPVAPGDAGQDAANGHPAAAGHDPAAQEEHP
jgi:hypothetical protein